MSKIAEYREALRSLAVWDAYLMDHSGLPGPRGNLELAQVVAALAGEERLHSYLAIPRSEAPENTPQVFLTFCGVLGLGRFICQGSMAEFSTLKQYASDDRWRIREAVAMALQTVGDCDMALLLRELKTWETGSLLEQRAVVAGLCEPRLLVNENTASEVIGALERITSGLVCLRDRKTEAFRVLKKALCYGWSVVVVAQPEQGKPVFERWAGSPDPDIRQILHENLRKNRMVKMDAAWVVAQEQRLAAGR